MRKAVIGILVIFLFMGNARAYAKEPSDTLRAFIDRTISVFQQFDTNNTSIQYKRKFECRLLHLAQDIFALNIMCRMVLARNWRSLTPREREEFQCLFVKMVEENYFDKIMEHVKDIQHYSKKNIQITEQILFSSRKAEVRTRIKYKDKYIPVNYRFVRLRKGWKIYDVYVEGVSLIQNYRSQFADLFLKKSFSQILDDMRAKVRDFKCDGDRDGDCVLRRMLGCFCLNLRTQGTNND